MCIYFDPRYMFDTKLAKIRLLYQMLQPKPKVCENCIFTQKKCIKVQINVEWVVNQIVKGPKAYF